MVQQSGRQNGICLCLRLVYASFWSAGLARLAQQFLQDQQEMCLWVPLPPIPALSSMQSAACHTSYLSEVCQGATGALYPA